MFGSCRCRLVDHAHPAFACLFLFGKQRLKAELHTTYSKMQRLLWQAARARVTRTISHARDTSTTERITWDPALLACIGLPQEHLVHMVSARRCA